MATVDNVWNGGEAEYRPTGEEDAQKEHVRHAAITMQVAERSFETVWNDCLEIIKADDHVSDQSFKTWFEPLEVVSLIRAEEQWKLTVQLPSRFYYEWLEEHFYSVIRNAITHVLGPDGRLYYNIVVQRNADAASEYGGSTMQLPARRPANEPAEGHTVHAPPARSRERIPPKLNANYTFYSFIEGDCNRLGRSASLAIAEEPGATPFNPFLVYGGVGLGKTHLIQAIGNAVLEKFPSQAVRYVSSETFTNEFVQAIQRNRVRKFSEFYRKIDVLIIDDVQFFGGKEKTQEEFFHIFNELHQSAKQIILSADRAPREIKGIEDRLLSRFHWGLTADLQPPELETRIAILNRKSADDGIEFPPSVIEFIARNIKSNVRELEGALIRLLAHATLYQREIDVPLAKDVLRDLIAEKAVKLTINQILEIVSGYFDIPPRLVRDKTRKREVVKARQAGMYFAKQLTQHSLKSIGMHFGGRDHSTVIHALRSVDNEIATNPRFRQTIEDLHGLIDVQTR